MDNLSLLLQAISTLCFFLGVFVIQSFKKSLDEMQKSVNSLNVNIATLVQTDKNKDERLAEHKDSIDRLDREVLKLRERYHDLANNMNGRINLLEMKLEDRQGE